MSWKFWEKGKNSAGATETTGAKLPKPKDLPQQIGMYLVVHEKQDPDRVWTFKYVARPRQERKDYFDFRIFDPDQTDTAKIHVADYNSLDAHPELILFQGKFDKNARDPELDRAPKAA